ncbi:MAG: hypothetical protein JJU33_14080 [Phycisphaerales bacterium]|nr:hypothetical protein [Phycisphaerales bacterium]
MAIGGVSLGQASPPSKQRSDSVRIVWEAELGEEEAHDESAWSAVAGLEAASEVAQQIAEKAERQWVELGQDEEKAAQLGRDAQTVLTAMFAPDFDTYHRHMTERGLFLDMVAATVAQRMVDREIYPDSVPELNFDAPLVTQVRYLWNHPRERGVEFESVRLSTLRVGFGLTTVAGTPDWPYMGEYGQGSLYAPRSGRLGGVERARLAETKDSAWVMIEGRFTSGMRTRMKIHFYLDSKAEVWVPVTVSFGTDGDFRPFPML